MQPSIDSTTTSLPSAYLDLLSILIRSPSVVGAEHSFFRVLQRELEERGADVTWYEGVLVAQGLKPESVMLSAHVDRHGLICTGPNEFQYSAFISGARSDLLGNSVSESMMNKIVDRFESKNVYAYEPWSGAYQGRGTIANSYICEHRNNLIFEVEGLEHLVAGTPIAFTDSLTITDSALVGQLDNVLTVTALIHLFEVGFEGTVFFTAQEEAGKSWRYLLEWFRRFGQATNQLIVVDTSPFADYDIAQEQQLVLRNKDANGDFNQSLTRRIESRCDELGLIYTFKDHYIDAQNIIREREGDKPLALGSTEMGRIITASQGLVDGTTVQIPTSGYHTMSESAPLLAVAGFLALLEDLSNGN